MTAILSQIDNNSIIKIYIPVNTYGLQITVSIAHKKALVAVMTRRAALIA